MDIEGATTSKEGLPGRDGGKEIMIMKLLCYMFALERSLNFFKCGVGGGDKGNRSIRRKQT